MSYKGFYKPINKNKYKGDASKVIYRSLKERQIMKFCDTSNEVISWSSEEIVIPYFYDVDNKMHRYFTDFYIEFKSSTTGKEYKFIVEYKPASQCKPPKKSKNMTRYYADAFTYVKNQNKWKAAEEFSKKNGMQFVVLTEKDTKDMNFFKNL